VTIRALLITLNEATGDTVPAEDIKARADMLALMTRDLPEHALGSRANVAAWHTFTEFPSLAALAAWLRGVAVLTAPQPSREWIPEPLAETKPPAPAPSFERLVPRRADA
jgi:hypothetical protein